MTSETDRMRGQADHLRAEAPRQQQLKASQAESIDQCDTTSPDSETALRQSEEKFRLAFQTSPDSIILSRLSDAKIIEFNEGSTKSTGYTQEEAIGKTALELGLWDDPGDRERLVAGLRKDGFVQLEAKFRRKDGQILTGLMSARVFRVGQEDIILSITRDITERKQAEDALRESEERHRQIVESSTDAILVRSGDIIIYANPAALKLFRASHAGELIGKRYLDLVHPDDRSESVDRIRRGMNEKWIAPPREHRIVALDGQVVHVESTGVPVQYQGETELFGVFRDITERKRAEEQLRETEKKYRELAESLPQVIFEVDLSGNLTYLNHTGYELFGYTPEEIAKGFSVLDAFIAEDRERVAFDIMLNIQGQRLGRQDYTAVRKDGTRFPVGVHADRVMSGPTATGVRGILIDLTATQRAQEEKKKLETQLQQAQKMEAIGALAGGIAHDFNNILSAIIGYIELAMLNAGAESGIDELREALKASNRAKDLVKQILAFSRQTDEERMPVRVGTIAREAAKFLRATIPTTIEIKTRIDERSGAVLANSVELHQIIMNLCTNAVHAMGETGGVLEIEVQNAEIDHALKNDSIGLEAGPCIRISVKDTGVGMSPEVMKRIFDPYFTTKEKGVGTGLGLAVVHGIVRKSGGTIEVESSPGHGAAFHVYLPRVDQPSSMLPKQAEIPEGGSERILFVDDEKMLVDIGQKVLERLGYDVVSRTSSIEALALFTAKPDRFDLVITDQTMPGMTGDVLARELMRIRPGLPVIICTGYSQAMDPQRAKQRGIKACVMKPILVNEIAAAIRKALAKE
ncbi:MAG: PAS domain S-box protein [Hyphomicrobiales bacterium]